MAILTNIISATHIFNFLYLFILSLLMLRESTRRNGFTRAIALIFAALALNFLWSVIFLFGLFPTQFISYAHRAAAGVILSLTLLYLLLKFWQEGRK